MKTGRSLQEVLTVIKAQEAADVESYDRATALEGIGWQVINMSAKQWKDINAA